MCVHRFIDFSKEEPEQNFVGWGSEARSPPFIESVLVCF